MPVRKLSCSDREPNLIVSLTSYGRRISKTLRFSLLSMLHQTRMPDRIVVWLNEKEFTMDSIPSYLKKYSDNQNILSNNPLSNLSNYKKQNLTEQTKTNISSTKDSFTSNYYYNNNSYSQYKSNNNSSSNIKPFISPNQNNISNMDNIKILPNQKQYSIRQNYSNS